MRHKHGYRKLGVDGAHRKAMLRNLATALVTHERIITTVPRAKELRRVVEKMITLGKKGELHGRRAAAGYLFEKDAVAKVFGDLATRFKDRKGGYTRILKTGNRAGDNASMALIELVDYELGAKK
ncbi:MAG: 50S ribosomal protein L17 [Bdellovibrionota bacterium]|nr:MAG: 50S ribosomal protein L17 [Pseudomonadota bacterium]